MGEEARGPLPCQGGVRVTSVHVCVHVCVCVGARMEAVLMYWSEPERMRHEELVARRWRDGRFWGGFPPPQLPGHRDVETVSF